MKQALIPVDFGGKVIRRPLGKPRYRWKDNMEMDHRELASGGKGGPSMKL
jgi:hypothetical protein